MEAMDGENFRVVMWFILDHKALSHCSPGETVHQHEVTTGLQLERRIERNYFFIYYLFHLFIIYLSLSISFSY